MLGTSLRRLVDMVRDAARPLENAAGDWDSLLHLIGDAHFVLLGEATHGTHEFYAARMRITQRLIEEKGFTAVAVEADWPDAYRVNRYVRGRSVDQSAVEALGGFQRFPGWMWRNEEVVALVSWLRAWNEGRAPRAQAGFYGLDLYSLHSSMARVVEYLEQVDPDAARRARERYGCFDDYGEEPQEYGRLTAFNISETCEQEVVNQLMALREKAAVYLSRDGLIAEDEQFSAEQNARLARNAEAYYRKMYRGNVSSWNLRDRHMAETLESLARHQAQQGLEPRIVVWEHNSHLGDARYTAMGNRGELNVGQLAREAHGDDAVLVGFTTYTGTVAAASDWGGPVYRKEVRPALESSYEALFHEVGLPAFHVPLRRGGAAAKALRGPLLERAIGVIYRPETERWSHYFEAELSSQFDAVIHYDVSSAVSPLERKPHWKMEPETYPTGL